MIYIHFFFGIKLGERQHDKNTNKYIPGRLSPQNSPEKTAADAGENPFSDPYGKYLNISGANTTLGGKRLHELFEKKDSNKSNLNNDL